MQLWHARLHVAPLDHVDNATVFENVMPIGETNRKMEVLLDQPHRKAALSDIADCTADLLHDHGRQPFGRFIECQSACNFDPYLGWIGVEF